MTNQRLQHASRLFGAIGAAFYFQPATVAVGKEHRLDGFRFYFLGRGGVLGDVEASVARSVFGYFEPGLFAKMWDSARTRMTPRDAARLYIGCAHEFGRERFAGVGALDEFCTAAGKLVDAIEPTGLALFAGVAAEPRPSDAPALAMHLAMVLREARGSVHLVALVASGVPTRIAHAIRRPDDVALFGWRDEVEVTDDHRARWQAAEALTNELLEPAYATLIDDELAALVAGAEAMNTAIT